MVRFRNFIIAAAAFISACGLGELSSDEQDPPPTIPDPNIPDDYNGGRHIARLTADELVTSVALATGVEPSIGAEAWREALGRPNLVDSVVERRSLSASAQRVMEDMAWESCERSVKADVSNGTNNLMAHVEERTEEVANVDANIKYLLLRFWGHRVTADDDAYFEPWHGYMTAATESAGDMKNRWISMCTALLVHPNFTSY